MFVPFFLAKGERTFGDRDGMFTFWFERGVRKVINKLNNIPQASFRGKRISKK